MRKSDVPIEKPCSADWEKMTPVDAKPGGRFCGDCKKVVRNLSLMTEREARRLMSDRGNEELCVRYLYDKHGKIFFGPDRKAQVVPASFLARAKRAAVAAAAVAVPLATQACDAVTAPLALDRSQQVSDHDDNQDEELYENMGGAPMPNDPPPDPDASDADASADASPDARRDDPDAGDAAPDFPAPL